MGQENQSIPKYSKDVQQILAAKDREAKDREAKLKADFDAKLKAQEAKSRVTTYALYTLQRIRIMRDCPKVCRACNAWQSTHLDDHGY